MEAPDPPGPLHGMRVLDLTTIVLGPYAAQILGDYGGEVIKVESPDGYWMRANAVSRHPGMSSVFLAVNRNRRSIALDLKQPAGGQVLLDLVAGVDVVVHNMRVGTIDRRGLGYEAAKAVPAMPVPVAVTGTRRHDFLASLRLYAGFAHQLAPHTHVLTHEGGCLRRCQWRRQRRALSCIALGQVGLAKDAVHRIVQPRDAVGRRTGRCVQHGPGGDIEVGKARFGHGRDIWQGGQTRRG